MSGLYNKYAVTHADGSPTDPNAQYFVLRIDTDYAARWALSTYISSIQDRDPEFARQLAEWLEATPENSGNPQIDGMVTQIVPYKDMVLLRAVVKSQKQQLDAQLSHIDRLKAELAIARTRTQQQPTIVCLCGSTRFMAAFQAANLIETLAGRIVLTVGCDTKSDDMLGLDDGVKAQLDELHKRKIDLADEILVLNIGGYIGSSTQSEIDYAVTNGKRVRYFEAESNPD